MTGLMMAPGWIGLSKPPNGGAMGFSVKVSADMGGL
jgi:hypothetical protein